MGRWMGRLRHRWRAKLPPRKTAVGGRRCYFVHSRVCGDVSWTRAGGLKHW
ncbi:hypothetical protein CGRA01v4_12884 [Colletotrichum graminicola]|nr:hypothetical protein CGRA01v4_12884 [Colletotrichum graminicola]